MQGLANIVRCLKEAATMGRGKSLTVVVDRPVNDYGLVLTSVQLWPGFTRVRSKDGQETTTVYVGTVHLRFNRELESSSWRLFYQEDRDDMSLLPPEARVYGRNGERPWRFGGLSRRTINNILRELNDAIVVTLDAMRKRQAVR